MNARIETLAKTLIALFLLLPQGNPVLAAENPDSGKKISKPASAPSEWSKKMRELYKTLGELLTDVVSDRRFNNPGNYRRIENSAKKLSTLSHDINKKKIVPPDADPSLQLLSGLFSDEADRAYRELKRGHRSYARSLLQSIPGYCIACHTRNTSGPHFQQLPLEPGHGLTDGFERAEFFAASRQFDRAQEELSTLVGDRVFAKARPLAWERAVAHALILAVRAHKDPKRALEIVDLVIESENAPYFLKQNAAQWRKSLLEWQSDPERSPKTEEGLYAEATRLIAKARELQRYPVDRSGDIFYLRASATIHELLQIAPNGERAAEALLLAGVCYEVLKPLRSDDLHELYYASCVEKTPHSPLAEVCYGRYQESVHSGFTGSAGTEIPAEVKARIAKLEELARPKELNPKNVKAAP